MTSSTLKNRKYDWRKDLKEKISQHDGVFGHNLDISLRDIKAFLSKIEKICICEDKDYDIDYIKIISNEDVDILLPKFYNREQILLLLLTAPNKPTNASYNKKKGILSLEWRG